MNLQDIPKIKHTNSNNFFLLAGPCAIEGEEMALRIAERIVEITNKLEIPYVFKGSFKKANRSRIDSFTGIGDEKALRILKKVSDTFDIPTVTDIHETLDAEKAAQFVDVLQIPAFLVRQTDLVVAAAKTGKVVNLKKGQFMSPEAMQHAGKRVPGWNLIPNGWGLLRVAIKNTSGPSKTVSVAPFRRIMSISSQARLKCSTIS